MIKTLLRLSVFLLLWACKSVPEPSSKAYYISSVTNNPTRKPVSDCTFRYKLDNSFDKLDNAIQQQGVRAAFDLWQAANPNIVFIQRQDTYASEIIIRFAEHSEIGSNLTKSDFGLIKGDIPTLSAAKEENNAYVILLDKEFAWDGQAITRVVAYHIGIFLGVNVSPDSDSVLNPVYVKETVRLSSKDSLDVRRLYPKPCSVGCNNFLPIQLKLLPDITKSIKLDKQGTVVISASGSMVVGEFVGTSTPVGLLTGILGFSLELYSIVPQYLHATVMYKINNEANWHSCGERCEFKTDGVSQCIDITLGINDKDILDNQGFYSVTVDYKK